MPFPESLPVGPALSVVIPIYNEEKNLLPLLEDLVPVMEGMGQAWECVLVNDGSTDGSAEILSSLAADAAWLRVVSLSENRGQGAALLAGLKAAQGGTIITLDGDRQNVPVDHTFRTLLGDPAAI